MLDWLKITNFFIISAHRFQFMSSSKIKLIICRLFQIPVAPNRSLLRLWIVVYEQSSSCSIPKAVELAKTVCDGPPKDVPIESKVKSKVDRPVEVQDNRSVLIIWNSHEDILADRQLSSKNIVFSILWSSSFCPFALRRLLFFYYVTVHFTYFEPSSVINLPVAYEP